ncbi:hypothetical protein LTR10_002885 [Elasticomyces elasticus]|nr:hypothetical protein LTR10_002885 [Elasticomyces elasticus]
MSPSLLRFLLLALTLTVFSAAFSNPLPCTGQCHDAHDPSLIRRTSDGKYFRFATGGGISIHTASSIGKYYGELVRELIACANSAATGPWANAGTVLTKGSSISSPGAGDAWAPDVKYVEGTYYLYYAVSSFGTQQSAIGVATSTSMDTGTWTDHGSTSVTSKAGDEYNAIDPNLIQVAGTNYLAFGSFWGDIFLTTLSSNLESWSGAKPIQIELNTTVPRPSEGACGSCCGYDTSRPTPGNEYKIMVCRSKTVTGGYVDKNGVSCTSSGGTLVLGSHGNVYGPGGQGIYDDPVQGSVLYYHYVDTNIGYSDGDKVLGVNKINWSTGWPVV